MSNEKEKQSRTPRNFDNILKGALSLSFGEKTQLVKELKAAIQTELDEINSQAEAAKKAAEGL